MCSEMSERHFYLTALTRCLFLGKCWVLIKNYLIAYHIKCCATTLIALQCLKDAFDELADIWPCFNNNQPFLSLQVTVNNEESDESFESSWSYLQNIQSNALYGHDRRTFRKEVTESKVMIQSDLLSDQAERFDCRSA